MKMLSSVAGSFVAISLFMGCISPGHGLAQEEPRWRDEIQPTQQGRALSHYIAATTLSRQGDRGGMLEQLRLAVAADPESLTPAVSLMRALYASEAFDEALKICERTLDFHPEEGTLWVEKGKLLHRLERFKEARQALDKALELDPRNVLGVDAMVKLQETTNDLVSEIEVFEGLIELVPNSAEMYYRLGTLLVRANDADGATLALQKALELNPNVTQARKLLGVLHLEAGRNEQSVIELAQYLRRFPQDIGAAEALVGGLTRLEKYAEALRVLNGLLGQPNAEAKYKILAMYVTLMSGNPEASITMTPEAGAPLLGQIFKAMSQQALDKPFAPTLERLDDIDGDLDTECSEILNSLLYQFDRETAGNELLRRIDALKSTGVTARTLEVVRARIMMSQGRHADALPLLTAVLDTYEADQWLHYYLAVSYEEVDNFKATEKHLKAYLEIAPEDADVMNFLGYLYAEKNVKLDEALELLQRALAQDPESPYYMDSIGWIYYRQNKAEKAIDYIQRAIYNMASDDAILRDHLGDAFLLQGETEKAVAQWRRAYRLDPTLEGVAEKLRAYDKS